MDVNINRLMELACFIDKVTTKHRELCVFCPMPDNYCRNTKHCPLNILNYVKAEEGKEE